MDEAYEIGEKHGRNRRNRPTAQPRSSQDTHILKIYTGLQVQIECPAVASHSDRIVHDGGIELEFHRSKKALRLLQYPEMNDHGAYIAFEICMKSAEVYITSHPIKKELSIISVSLKEDIAPQVFDRHGNIPVDLMVLANTRNWCTIPFKSLASATAVEVIFENGNNAAKALLQSLQSNCIDTKSHSTDFSMLSTCNGPIMDCDNITNRYAGQEGLSIGSVETSSTHEGSSRLSNTCITDSRAASDSSLRTREYSVVQADMLAITTAATAEQKSSMEGKQAWCDFTNHGKDRLPQNSPNTRGKSYARARRTRRSQPHGHHRMTDRATRFGNSLDTPALAREPSDALSQWNVFAEDPDLPVKGQAPTTIGRNFSMADYHKEVKEAWSDKAKQTRYKIGRNPNSAETRTNSAPKQTHPRNCASSAHVEYPDNILPRAVDQHLNRHGQSAQPTKIEMFSGNFNATEEDTDLLDFKRRSDHNDVRTKAKGGARFRPVLEPIKLMGKWC